MKVLYSGIYNAIGKPCPYCGVGMLAPELGSRFSVSREHVFPRCKGGRIVIIACSGCNNEKGDRLPYEWIEYLYDRGQRERAHRTIRAYCLLRTVFALGTRAEDVIAACDEMVRLPVAA